jgi:hypothetical protein
VAIEDGPLRKEATVTRSVFIYAVVALATVQLIGAATGLAVNPDFSTGSDATAVEWLGVDVNGWHSVAGMFLGAPGLLLLRWPQYTRRYVYWIVGVLLVTAVWGALQERPLGLLFFPDKLGDLIFHIASATGFAALLLLDRADRATVAA